MKFVALTVFMFAVFTASLRGQNAPSPAPQNPLAQALLKACQDNNLDEAGVLIDQGAPLEGTDASGCTPLIAAAEQNPEITRKLIAKGAQLDVRDHLGGTALLHACWVDNADCALALINAGADSNLGSNAGQTPLMYAASQGDDKVASALIARHANLNANCAQGSAAWWAVGHNHFSTFVLLAAAGADFNLLPSGKHDPGQFQSTLLGESIADGDKEITDFLLQHGADVNFASGDGTTALMTASAYGDYDAILQLLNAGAKIDLQGQDGQTALMKASYFFVPIEIVKALVDHKAGLDLKDKQGRTALICACSTDNDKTARYLIDAGADVNVTDARGETALTHAGDLGMVDIVDELKSKGANRTDVHVIAKEEPAQPLPAPRAWALAVGAIYTQKFGGNPKVLGGQPASLDGEKKMLARDWGIQDKAGLLKELDDLRDKGHHAAYQAAGAKLAALDDDKFADLLQNYPDQAPSLKANREAYLKWKERTALAWDLCRSAMLVNEGYAVHYLSEPEAWDRLMSIAQQTQASFSSWEEMNDNFLDGREIWANHRDPRFEALSRLLLNPADPNSPWTQNPWKTDLTAPIATN